MSQLTSEIPLGLAVRSISLGHDLANANIDKISCRVPCIYRNGILVPTMEGIRSRYPMHPFNITIRSFDEIGGGVMDLTPQPFSEGLQPQVDLPIYMPPEGNSKEDCDAVEEMLCKRFGHASLLAKFPVATLIDDGGEEQYVGEVSMFGKHGEDEIHLPYEQDAAAFYVGLIFDNAKRKLDKTLDDRRQLARAVNPGRQSKVIAA